MTLKLYPRILLIILITLKHGYADDSGLFFNSAPYNTGSGNDESWKDTGDPNPWIVETPGGNDANKNTKTEDVSNAKDSANQNVFNQQSQNLNEASKMVNNQQNARNTGSGATNNRNRMGSPGFSNSGSSGSQVKDIYLKSVNTGEDLSRQNNRGHKSQNQRTHNSMQNQRFQQNQNSQDKEKPGEDSSRSQSDQGPKQQNQQSRNNGQIQSNQQKVQNEDTLGEKAEPEEAGLESLSSRYSPNSFKNGRRTRVYSSNNNQPEPANKPTPVTKQAQKPTTVTTTPTTTTTTRTTTKYGDGMFFNAKPYNNDQKRDKDQEDWKRDNEPNPFLVDNPNKPRQIVTAPPPPPPPGPLNHRRPEIKMPPDANFDRRDPESIRRQRPEEKKIEEPPQVWKTKWQQDEEDEELKRKTLEKAKYVPPVRNELENYQKRVDTQHQHQHHHNNRPGGPHHRAPSNNMMPGPYGMRREELERSGEIERVPENYYKGKLGTLPPSFKFMTFMEPDPEPEPQSLQRHSKSKLTAVKSLEIEKDPPTTIQKMKNWFVKNPLSSSSVTCCGDENIKLLLGVFYLVCIFI